MKYPVNVDHEVDGSIVLTFVDLPAITCGDSIDDALANAVDALETAVDACIKMRETVPRPSKLKEDQLAVLVPPQVKAKILIWNEMIKQGLRKADIARRLEVKPPQIDRLFDIRHGTRLADLEKAAEALGKRIELRLV